MGLPLPNRIEYQGHIASPLPPSPTPFPASTAQVPFSESEEASNDLPAILESQARLEALASSLHAEALLLLESRDRLVSAGLELRNEADRLLAIEGNLRRRSAESASRAREAEALRKRTLEDEAESKRSQEILERREGRLKRRETYVVEVEPGTKATAQALGVEGDEEEAATTASRVRVTFGDDDEKKEGQRSSVESDVKKDGKKKAQGRKSWGLKMFGKS